MGLRNVQPRPQQIPYPRSPVRVIPLLTEQPVTTDGTTTFRYIPLDLPEVAEWGPHLAQIMAAVETRNVTANFQWKIVMYWSMDGSEWEGPVDLFGALSSGPGRSIQAAFTDRGKLGPVMRFALGVANTTGAAIESAEVSCTLFFEFLR